MDDPPPELNFLSTKEQERERVNDDDDNSGDSNNEDEQALPHVAYPDELTTVDKPPVIRRGGGNTGPKGVLADYADAKEQERYKREREKKNALNLMNKMAFTVNNNNNSNNSNNNNNNRNNNNSNVNRNGKYIKNEEENIDNDEEFLKEYRKKRLEELRIAQRPTFGFLRSIDSSEYVDSIDKENKDVFVVVHLYKNEIRECVLLNYILQNLAIKYPSIKFLKIISTEAKPDYEDAGLPSLLIYKGGELLKCWVPITVKLGRNFESGDVELLLARAKIIKTSSIDKKALLHKDKTVNDMSQYDDSLSEDEDY